MKEISPAKQRYYSGHPQVRVPAELIPIVRKFVEAYRKGTPLTSDAASDVSSFLKAIAQ